MHAREPSYLKSFHSSVQTLRTGYAVLIFYVVRVCRDFPSSCSYLLTGARRRRWDYYLSRIWWRMAARSAYDSLHTLTWWCWEKRERWCLALAFDDWLYWIPNNYYYAILLRSSQLIILHAIIDDRTNDRYYVVVVRSIDLIFWFDSFIPQSFAC